MTLSPRGLVVSAQQQAGGAVRLEPPRPSPEIPQFRPDWLTYFNLHRDWPMPRQQASWTCSVAALTWLLQATNLDPDATREQVLEHIGYPACVNEQDGLESTDCLIRVLARYGVRARQQWVNFDLAYVLSARTAGILNGIGWYHFVGLRGIADDALWVANSAPGHKGVYEILGRADFERLGPFQVIYLDVLP